MGLDISFGNNIKKISEEFADDYNHQTHVNIPDNDYFYAQQLPITHGHYSFDSYGSFHLGSYGTYNSWRNLLSRIALGVSASAVWNDRNRFCNSPFYELIDFSDCEGVIGSIASAKLSRDFTENRERIFAHHEADEWFRGKYDSFATAFSVASDNGFVRFH